MYQFVNSRFCRAFCLFLALLYTATSCKQHEVVAPTVEANVQDYSNQQLFEGVFLMQGEVADKISFFQPYLHVIAHEEATTPGLRAARVQQAHELYQAVLALNPTFPSELKQAIVSHNFNDVQAALNKGALLTKSALLVKSENNKAYQQGQELVKSLDLKKYDFKSEQGLTQFVKDAKAQAGVPAGNGSSSGGHHASGGHHSKPSPGALVLTLAAVVLVAAIVVHAAILVTTVGGVVAVAAVIAVAAVAREAADPNFATNSLERETMVREISLNIL